jgi:outer membrane protein assembly factor BamB
MSGSRIPLPAVCLLLAGAIALGQETPPPGAREQPAATSAAKMARQIINQAGVRGGLVVHVGCGDGRLTAALRIDDGYLVHGLEQEVESVEKARQHIQKLGLYGPVCVARWSGRRLPYVDNLVNLLAVEDASLVPKEEMLRVLAPGGVACIRDGAQWTRLAKRRPEELDEWTHNLYDASGNAVSRDRAVGPPHHLQWVAPPRNTRSHDVLASVSAAVTSGGRLFYIIDESPPAVIGLPARWSLVARDASNGVLLWKRPIESWEPHLRGFRQGPPELGRRLVAAGDRVYATMRLDGPLAMLDAATGETVRTYQQTENCEEVLHDQQALFVVAGDATPAERRVSKPSRGGPLLPFPRGTVNKRIVVLDTPSGRVLWSKSDGDTKELLPMTLAVSGDRVVAQNSAGVVCLDRADGETLWRFARPADAWRRGWSAPTLVVHKGVVLSVDRVGDPGDVKEYLGEKELPGYFGIHQFTYGAPAHLIALSLKDGSKLWECPCAEGFNSPVDVFVARDLVWIGQKLGRGATAPDFTAGHDLLTGEIKKRLSTDEAFTTVHHHRCYRNRVAGRYLLMGRTGVEFIDLESGDCLRHNWVRGVCQYGVVPANGLLYAPPHACACYFESKLNGFYALAPQRRAESGKRKAEEAAPRLERGPAYAPNSIHHSSLIIHHSDDWPTYRHDGARSGSTAAEVPAAVGVAWETEVGARLSSPTVAGGKVFVADVDAHTVHALDAASGKRLWSFTAGGRVDSPPTIHQGLALFGSADGWVYCVRAADGRLAWRFRAAPDDRRAVAFDSVESVWPVPGSVLVHDGVLFCTAGRSSYLDGGMHFCRLDPPSGELLSERTVCDRDPKTGRQPEEKLFWLEMPGALPDVLSSDGQYVYMRQGRYSADDFRRLPYDRKPWPIDGDLSYRPDLQVDPAFWVNLYQDKEGRHLYSPGGFLDGSWYHRAYMVYGTQVSSGYAGWAKARSYVPAGRILVMDESRVYGYGEVGPRFRLFAAEKNPSRTEPTPAPKPGPAKAKRTAPRPFHVQRPWSIEIPMQVRAMVLTEGVLFAAGHPDVLDADVKAMGLMRRAEKGDREAGKRLFDQLAAWDGEKGGLLWAVSPTSGEKKADLPLDSPPVWDGMAAADGRLYVATLEGKLICLAAP